MMFWFKKKKLIVDMFTVSTTVFNAAKPRLANRFYPDWWKELKQDVPTEITTSPLATMRGCSGFIEHYRHGFVVPMWTDLKVEVGEIGSPYFQASVSDNMTTVVYHDPRQRGRFAPESNFLNLKLENPWLAKCSESIPFKWEQLTWSSNKLNECIVLPGTVEYKYQHFMQLQLLFCRSDTRKMISIDFGDPLVHVTPLTERELDLRYHLVSVDEFNKLVILGERISFTRSYMKYKKALKLDQKGCPYA